MASWVKPGGGGRTRPRPAGGRTGRRCGAVPWGADNSVSTPSTVTVPNHLMAHLVGPLNENLRLVEDAFPGARIIARGNEFTIDGDDAALAERTVDELRLLLEQGHAVDAQVVHRTIDMIRADECPSEVLTSEVLRSAKGRSVRPKTSGQKRYTDAIAKNIITFGIGPAGTGKSYLAVALAVQALQAKTVEPHHPHPPGGRGRRAAGVPPRRPDGQDRPLPSPAVRRAVRHARHRGGPAAAGAGTVEVAPLAYMRGRTLNSSFIILDEAQNTTPEQMKMFLTRIGFGSKVVITGDDTQIDLAGGRSGLVGLEERCTGSTGWPSSASAGGTWSATASCRTSSTPTKRRQADGFRTGTRQRRSRTSAGRA